ncbi:Platelet-derived growth factor receptor-like protein [Vulpes lagopus]
MDPEELFVPTGGLLGGGTVVQPSTSPASLPGDQPPGPGVAASGDPPGGNPRGWERHLLRYPSSSPKPTIQASATSVQLGENFSVTCTALGELEIAVDFIWEYPGQKGFLKELEFDMTLEGGLDQQKYGEALGRPPYVSKWASVVHQEGQVQQVAGSTPYVEEAWVGDSGIYTCQATNLQGMGTAITSVRVNTGSRHISPAPS